MRRLIPLLLVVGACSSASAPTSTNPPSTPAPTTVTTTVPTTRAVAPTTTTATTRPPAYDNLVASFEYRDGLRGDVFAPAASGPWPVAVTVHGGGWFVGDPASMEPLADYLAGEGIVTFNVTYRTMSQGGGFPDMVDDVACAVAEARQLAARYTETPDEVTIIGHSAGAHLAALVVFAPDEFACSTAAPRSFVGLAGPYDTDQLEMILAPFFGTRLSEDPEPWKRGNPMTYTDELTGLRILLLHGELDSVVPAGFSRVLAEAIDPTANDLQLVMLEGIEHVGVRDPNVVGDSIVEFINGR